MVFDNAEDLRALSRFLPDGPGPGADHLAQPGLARDRADVVGVREFTRAESIALLRRRAPDLTEAEAERLRATLPG